MRFARRGYSNRHIGGGRRQNHPPSRISYVAARLFEVRADPSMLVFDEIGKHISGRDHISTPIRLKSRIFNYLCRGIDANRKSYERPADKTRVRAAGVLAVAPSRITR